MQVISIRAMGLSRPIASIAETVIWLRPPYRVVSGTRTRPLNVVPWIASPSGASAVCAAAPSRDTAAGTSSTKRRMRESVLPGGAFALI